MDKSNAPNAGGSAGADIRPVSPWRMAEALIKVMQVVAKPARYLRLGKALIQEGITPEDLLAWYGEGGRWWEEDWRGKRGQHPTEFAIRETAKTYLGEPVRSIVTTQVKSADALDAWMAQTGARLNG